MMIEKHCLACGQVRPSDDESRNDPVTATTRSIELWDKGVRPKWAYGWHLGLSNVVGRSVRFTVFHIHRKTGKASRSHTLMPHEAMCLLEHEAAAMEKKDA